MAEEKGGGGGSEWTALEIVLVLILAIALIQQLSGKRLFPVVTENTSKQEETSYEYDSSNFCGLSVFRPKPMEKVTTFVTLAGETNGCNWPSTPQVALYAQVVDSKGKPVSGYLTIPPISYTEYNAEFSTIITLNSKPAKGIGYLILVPSKSSSAGTASARIPVQFTD